MSDTAKTACQRCRDQKLRCSRELPECSRCGRFGASCVYPPPPDRKALAQQRNPPKKRSTVRPSTKRRTNLSQSEALDSDSPTGSPTKRLNISPFHNAQQQESVIHLSPAVSELLQETYFNCQFHSSLLFHRPTFQTHLMAGLVPQHTLLALYASAFIFIHPESSISTKNVDLLHPLGDLKILGHKYAISAGQQVLCDIDRPTFESVRTCEMLSLYWFSRGDLHRHVMFLSIASKASALIGLNTENADSCFDDTETSYTTLPRWLKCEMARRCFWAIWYTQCISSDHSLADVSLSPKILDLSLPMSETAFLVKDDEQVGNSATIAKIASSDVQHISRNSILAELMVAMHFWAKVRMLLDSRLGTAMSAWIPKLYELDAQLTSWYSSMPDSFAYTKRNLYEQRVQGLPPLFPFLHTVYYQCRLVLHSSLVPQFSGLHLPKSVLPEFIHVGAQRAIRGAQDLSSMGADLVALNWDPAQLPAFFGYAMYSAASIHIALLGSADEGIKKATKTALKTSLRWLRALKVHWSNLDKLWIRINVLYEVQIVRLRGSSTTNGTTTNPVQSNLKELDQLAGEVRDASQLAEPLADSVLSYSLQQLRPSPAFSSEAMRELEASLDFELMELFIQEASPSDPQPLLSNHTDLMQGFGMPSTSAVPAFDGAFFDPPNLMGDWISGSGFSGDLQQPWDWWGVGKDLLEPILPYDNLLEFG